MKIVVLDDEPIILEMMVELVEDVSPDSEVVGFDDPFKLIEYMKENQADVAFLDIQVGRITGIEVAKNLKFIDPNINIIFVTSYSEHMEKAFSLRASGYIMKPPSREKIIEELNNLRNPISEEVASDILEINCFGNFEAFYNGEPLKFKRSKTKELLAFLVDRKGAGVTAGEICATIWEDDLDDEKNKGYLRILSMDLANTLKTLGCEDVFVKSRNSYAIDTKKIKCDLYDYIDNKPDAIRKYNGEYMMQYSWSEYRQLTSEE